MIKKVLLYLFFLFFLILTTSCSYAASDLEISLNSSQLKQGEILKVTVKGNTETLQNFKRLTFNEKQYKLHKSKNNKKFTALIPVSYWLAPGKYKLQITSQDSTKILYSKSIEVQSGDFVESRITVSSKQEEKVRPQKQQTVERKEKDSQLIAEARKTSSSQKLWQESFIWPVKGKISSPFGATRYVNATLQSRHSGIDIAAKAGTPIKACAGGKVTLATDLLVTGDTIIVDHGWNVFSSYSHLQDIQVEKNQIIEKGEVIGSLGSSGFSTGPHLHWAVNVNGVFVNPEYFLKNTFIH